MTHQSDYISRKVTKLGSLKIEVQITHFWRIINVFCERYAHRIFYGPRNFKIRFFGKNLKLKLYHDRLIHAFLLGVNSSQNTLKIISKSDIFYKSSEYSVEKYAHRIFYGFQNFKIIFSYCTSLLIYLRLKMF